MGRYVIVGGAGFIGCNLVSRLLRDGKDVLVVDDLSRAGADENLRWLRQQGRVEFVRCDIRDTNAVEAIFKGTGDIEVVFHLAAQVAVTRSIVDPRHDFEVNVLGTINVLEAIRHSDSDPLLVYSSTNKVYGEMDGYDVVESATRYELPALPRGVSEAIPLDLHSPYGCSKGAADQYVRDYARIFGLRSVVLRQSCIYGQRQFGVEDQAWVAWFIIASVLEKPLTLFGTGKQVRDLLFIDDLIELYLRCVECGSEVSGEIYNVGGGPNNAVSLLESIECLEAISGRRTHYSFADWRLGDQRIYVSDVAKAERDLGWRPQVTVAEGIKRIYEWVVENRSLITSVMDGHDS
ncbi:MAG: SDR family NAD(P)-dependent oxidoreductase [Vicinamibacterales bacterium]|nr:CDP-paratose 2-epimerase [Acidobacteriota bacterium]MDP7671707.1 SDR family NAD(P)-dependent oxidoreductase [Vicinamibacterales bacterium]HJO39519.1 SDR family NAD(P)-dependent oxidoreductase [Vicinamibacterales bacterium]